MFAFLRKQKPARKDFQPFPMGYNAEEFRSNPGMVLLAENFRKSGLGQHLFSALYNGIPYGYPERGKDMSPTTASIELGRMQGYMDCMMLLQSLCTVPLSQIEVPQDYGADELLKSEGLPIE